MRLQGLRLLDEELLPLKHPSRWGAGVEPPQATPPSAEEHLGIHARIAVV